MEHKRWWADRALDGWTFGSTHDGKSDLTKKLHPDMKKYDKLDEVTKDYDRESVNTMVEIFKKEGFDIVMASKATTASK
jgi:hypothetical protein